jgi:hypothetical protein
MSQTAIRFSAAQSLSAMPPMPPTPIIAMLSLLFADTPDLPMAKGARVKVPAATPAVLMKSRRAIFLIMCLLVGGYFADAFMVSN